MLTEIKFLYRLTALCLAALLMPQFATAQTLLQYQYRAGDVLQYELKQTLTTKANFGAEDMENVLAQKLHLATRVDQVHSDGSADMTKRIVRIQMYATQPGKDQPIEYDSNSQEELPGSFRMIAESLSELVNHDIQMQIDASGFSKNVKLPPELERLGEKEGGIAGVNSADGVKRMIAQGSLIFPSGPIQLDESWTREMNTELPFGLMTSKIELTYAGTTPEGLHRINATSRIQMTPKPGAPFEVDMKAAEGRGIYLFDAERGCLYASALKQLMQLEMSALGQVMKQTVETDITMRLLENGPTRTATRN